MPVSYTHLDVYKRQDYPLPKAEGHAALYQECSFCGIRHERPLLAVRFTCCLLYTSSIDVSKYNDGERGGAIRVRSKIEKIDNKTLAIKAVSYTHLDVYKRQGYRRLVDGLYRTRPFSPHS